MDLPRTADVIIVGGGVMGASTAYHLSRKGCKGVVLLERNPFLGQEATGKCAGGIRYQFSSELNIQLSLLSLPMLERFEEEVGRAIDLRPCGYLILLTREEDVKAFRNAVNLQHRFGLMTEWLTMDGVRTRLPVLHSEDVLAATWYSRDGLADPSSVVQGYISEARRPGVKCLTGVEVTGIIVESGRVRGVETRYAEIATAAVVNAAGPWAAQVGALANVEIPVLPVRRQIAVTTPIPQLSPDFPFIIEFAKNLYFHREGLGILTGMSNPNESYGFNQKVDHEWELVHFEAAMKRVPLLAEARVRSRWAGLYEVSPDSHPILGKVPEAEGFYCINGFSGHGFMHGPACGLLLAEEILDGKAHTMDITSFNLSRFREGRLIVEHNVI